MILLQFLGNVYHPPPPKTKPNQLPVISHEGATLMTPKDKNTTNQATNNITSTPTNQNTSQQPQRPPLPTKKLTEKHREIFDLESSK